MSSNFQLPYCPYCGTKLFYVEALTAKNRSKFKCPCCKRKSEVTLDPLIFKLLGAAELMSLIIFIIVMFLGCKFCLIGLAFIILVFGVFYFLSPLLILLRPQKNPSPKKKQSEKLPKKQVANDVSKEEIFSD